MTITAKQLADEYPVRGSMPAEAVRQMYDLRDAEVVELSNKPAITINDVQALERTGRCVVAESLWKKCDATARKALLNDEHHFVRSCAAISNRAAA